MVRLGVLGPVLGFLAGRRFRNGNRRHYGVRVDQSRCAQQMSAPSVMRQIGIYFAGRR